MRSFRMLRIIALCLLVVLLCSSCTMLGIRSRRTDPMMINGTKVTCTQLDSGDYYSGSIRSLVNYLGMQADFPWYTIPADVLAAGGHLYASIATEQIVDSMNYFAWDYRPNDTDVPRMQIILERYGFTSENRITPKWLEENIHKPLIWRMTSKRMPWGLPPSAGTPPTAGIPAVLFPPSKAKKPI